MQTLLRRSTHPLFRAFRSKSTRLLEQSYRAESLKTRALYYRLFVNILGNTEEARKSDEAYIDRQIKVLQDKYKALGLKSFIDKK